MQKRNESRQDDLLLFGFGTEVMKNSTVCEHCHSLQASWRRVCSECGTPLPKTNLYDLYRSQHSTCKKCASVLSDSMQFCPHCGEKVHE